MKTALVRDILQNVLNIAANCNEAPFNLSDFNNLILTFEENRSAKNTRHS